MHGFNDSPWAVAEQAFPWRGTPGEQLHFLLNYAVLAPSGHNTQPWRFRVTAAGVELLADRTRALPVVDPEDRELTISCGAALLHLRVALAHYGLQPQLRLLPDVDQPDLLADIRIGVKTETPVAASLEMQRLFQAIKKRRTNRLPFEARAVREEDLHALSVTARREGARLHLIRHPEKKAALAELIAEGDRLQGGTRRYRRELAAWVHPNRSPSRDGIPGYAAGLGDLLSYAGPFVMRTFNWGRGQGNRDRQMAAQAPALLVLSTPADDPAAWLAAGQALDRVLLQAADAGLSASFFNQPIELYRLRPHVAGLIDRTGYPQIIMRLGHGRRVYPTPRRAVAEVLAESRYA